ncbi:hypothetical protein GQR58_011715 [Nymphon striatum]|nr:hypothetical protein GQR58_011715 [Nymphon striatum]
MSKLDQKNKHFKCTIVSISIMLNLAAHILAGVPLHRDHPTNSEMNKIKFKNKELPSYHNNAASIHIEILPSNWKMVIQIGERWQLSVCFPLLWNLKELLFDICIIDWEFFFFTPNEYLIQHSITNEECRDIRHQVAYTQVTSMGYFGIKIQEAIFYSSGKVAKSRGNEWPDLFLHMGTQHPVGIM